MNNKERGDLIRRFILKTVSENSNDIVATVSKEFAITPQAVNAHIKHLVKDGWLAASGVRRGKRYFLSDNREYSDVFLLSNKLAEDVIWRDHFSFVFEGLPENIADICHYGFTEILNNAIDHSGGSEVYIRTYRDSSTLKIAILDNGEGIFSKIKRILELVDDRQALFELSKGKLTTDENNHSGEGIFFTSRMFDAFYIHSKGLIFTHNDTSEYDFLQETEVKLNKAGTIVFMEISRDSIKDLRTVFDSFTAGPEDYKFNKTVVPVRLAQYGNEKLMSRSQAKRVLNRVDKFHWIVFDFEGVPSIGQAFADEIFRVYALKNPQIKLTPIKMNDDVTMMVNRSLP